MKYLIIDGEVNGTGIKDEIEQVYINPISLGLSEDTMKKLNHWKANYEKEFYNAYPNNTIIDHLDKEGIEIAKKIQSELPFCKVSYFSDARFTKIIFPL